MFRNIMRLLVGIILILWLVSCGGGSSKNSYENVDLKTFKIEFLEYGKVKVSWDAVKNADSYQVKHYRPSLFLYSSDLPFEVVNSPSIILDNLDEGKWFVSVRPSNGEPNYWVSPTIELTMDSAKITGDTGASEDLSKITKNNISGKTFEITNLKYPTPFIVTFNEDKTITNVLGSEEYPFSKVMVWDVSKTGELKTILKTYSEDEILELFIHKQIGYKDGCYLINTKQVDSSSWKNKYKLCPSSTDIKKVQKIVAVSGNSNEDDWNSNFEMLSIAEVNKWGGGMIPEIPFYSKMIVDFGFFKGSKEDKEKHENPSYMILGDKSYIIIELLDKDNYLLHSFHFSNNQEEREAFIKFDDNQYNINQLNSQDILQGFIKIENNQLVFEGEYNMTKKTKKIFKTWNILDFESVKKVHIDIGVLHTKSEGISQIPIYIEY